jgi:hypothetical protein
MSIWQKVLLGVAGLLALVFAGMILKAALWDLPRKLIREPTPQARRHGFSITAFGIGLLVIAGVAVWAQEALHAWLGTSMVFPAGAAVAGLASTSEGLGIVMFGREHVGIAVVIWSVLAFLAYWAVMLVRTL